MSGETRGRTIIITGGSSGIGAAAARALRKRGDTVVITGRSPATAELAKEIGADYVLADFAKFRDVRALAETLLARYPRIDVLANNVGGMIWPRQVTEDGHERTFQVNHLSGFLLTLLLRDRLEESRATIINTSSRAHHRGRLDFDDLENAAGYNAWRAYGTAKLMNILHAIELNRRFRDVHAVSFHPGVVATGFGREGSAGIRWLYESSLGRLVMISPEKGADTLVWLATTTAGADWKPGEYFIKRRPGARSREARDPSLARQLWDESTRLVG